MVIYIYIYIYDISSLRVNDLTAPEAGELNVINPVIHPRQL